MGHRSTPERPGQSDGGSGTGTRRTVRGARRRRELGFVVAVLVVLALLPAGVMLGIGDGVERPAPVPSGVADATRHPTVLLVGDSLIHQAADGLRAALPDATVVDGSVPGSGILNGPVDWATRAQELVSRYRPDVVVVSFVGNYDRATGSLVPDSRAFDQAWGAAAQRLTVALRAREVRVDWVAAPPVAFPNFYDLAPARVAMVTATARRLATMPGVGFVDADDPISGAISGPISGPGGSYAATHAVCGASVEIRLADGVHFTGVGADWWGASLAVAVARLEQLPAIDPCTVVAALDPGLG
jgi:hypothetical protein